MRFFRIDGPFYRLLETITNLIILNFLFLVCSIPIVTIGPALTASYYVTLKIVRNEETSIIKNFFHSFRMNFKQGLLLGIGVILLAAVLLVDIRALTYLTVIPKEVSKVLIYVIGFLLLLLALVSVYLFAVLAQFENKLSELIKWSAVLVIRHLPSTVICLVILAAPVLIFYFAPAFFLRTLLPVLLLLGFSGIAYLQSRFLVPVFDYYIPKKEEESSEEEDSPEEDFPKE